MFLIRLSPFIPFNLFNYAMGITNVSLRDYLIGMLGMFPGNVLFVYIGTAFESIDELVKGEYDGGKMHYGVFMGGLVVTMAAFCWITYAANAVVIRNLDAQEEVEAPKQP
jgi:hypothetical protein